MADRDEVRLNSLDWMILEALSDGRRYTQKFLSEDVEEFEDVGYDWIRQRVAHLHGHGLIQKVGSSSMYVISDDGRAALDLKDEYDSEMPPAEFGQMVRDRAVERRD